MDGADLPENVSDILPLSPVQEGVLYEVLASPQAEGRYQSVHRITLNGPLDPESFERIFVEEALRCDVSRAGFVHEGLARPLAVIQTQVALPFVFEDWTGRDDHEASLDARAEALVSAPCTLAKAPLMGAELYRLGPERHVLLWSIHHLISDAWSTRVVLETVLARLNQGTSAAPAPGPSYRDHLTRIAQRDRAGDRAYFQRYLEGVSEPSLLLPEGHAGTDPFQSRTTALPAPVSAALRSTARRERVTLATALCLAWALCLRRYIRQEDILFGRVNAGRDPSQPGVDRAIGPYLNVTPARFQLPGDLPLGRALAQAETGFAASRPHEGARLADALPQGAERTLFDTLLSIQGFALPASDGPLQITHMQGRDATSFPLAMILRPGDRSDDGVGDRIEIEAVYDPTRLDTDTVDDLLAAYRAILAGMAEAPPQTPLAELPGLPLPPVSSVPPVPAHPPVASAIAQAATRTPDAVAIRAGDETLSFAALHRGACQLAARLQGLGIGSGDIVPVIAARKAQTPMAMLATHYAGAAFCPIDPDYPEDRNRAILDQLKPKCVIADQGLPGWSGPCLPAQSAEDAPQMEPVTLDPDGTAYVIFTSGSTGKPKGVVISHGNLAWSTFARGPVYGASPTAFLHLSSFAFDSAMVGLFWTLTGGGTLVIAPPRAEQDPKGLAALAQHSRASHLLCLPQLWAQLLQASAALPDSLQTVIVAGEAVPGDLPAQHEKARPGTQLYNEYGPTEASIWCASANLAAAQSPIPIGKAPPGAALDPCDLDGWRMPRGLTGELTVRGAGLGQGYLHGAGAMGGFGTSSGTEPRYRTGDLGQVGRDGQILCLGRVDEQVKIRGFRVELGEIEAAARSEGATEAVAAASHGRIILAVSGAEAIEGLQTALEAHLPRHMRPAALHRLPVLPRLPNGKFDRKAVAALGLGSGSQPATSAPPRAKPGHIETRLAEIWARHLNQPVGPDTDFFAAGGDSLMTIAILSEAERAGIMLRPGDIFDTPVLGDLVATYQARLDRPVAPSENRLVSRVNEEGTRIPVLMIHGSAGFNAALAGSLGSDRPCVFQWSHHMAGRASLREGVATLARQAIAAFDQAHGQGPVIIAGYSIGGVIAQHAAGQLAQSGREVRSLILIDPTNTIAPPKGQPEPAKRWIGRWLRAGYSVVLSQTRYRSARHRLARVGHIYRAILAPYRQRSYGGHGLVLYTELTELERNLRQTATPAAELVKLTHTHLDLIDNREAIAEATSAIAAHIYKLEQETGP